jgi:hypothetical protein
MRCERCADDLMDALVRYQTREANVRVDPLGAGGTKVLRLKITAAGRKAITEGSWLSGFATASMPTRQQHAVPPPWHADKMPSGYVVRDANGQAIAYLYSRDNPDDGLQPNLGLLDDIAGTRHGTAARIERLLGSRPAHNCVGQRLPLGAPGRRFAKPR